MNWIKKQLSKISGQSLTTLLIITTPVLLLLLIPVIPEVEKKIIITLIFILLINILIVYLLIKIHESIERMWKQYKGNRKGKERTYESKSEKDV